MHPLEKVMAESEGFVLIGDSSQDFFPATSYDVYHRAGVRFYCLDLGGLTESRGSTRGGKVYPTVEQLPEDHGDLAIIWVPRKSSARAVDAAHAAGCTRVWFSFHAGHPDGVARARELGMEVVEVGRCPVYYLDAERPFGCRAHAAMTKLTGAYGKPPQTEAVKGNRELW